METIQITSEFVAELLKAKAKFPRFPTDPVHAVAIMAEEAGEAVQASLLVNYESHSIERIKKEVIQTGAMCIRILNNIEKFQVSQSAQVKD